jgi:hypothetical protein
MTSGDEPMLPHSHDDNAPMISGRGTKVIADARGAYLAGNLRALLEHLPDHYFATYIRTLIDFVLWYSDQAFQLLPVNSGVYVEYETIKADLQDRNASETPSLIVSWGDDDYHEPTYLVHRLLEQLEGLRQSRDELAEFVQCSINAVSYAYQAEQAIQEKDWHTKDEHRVEWLTRRYAIEVVWSVLRGQPPVSIEMFLSDDRQMAYRTADLTAILHQMTDEQKLNFRFALVRRGTAIVERVLPQTEDFIAERTCLEAVQHWLIEPNVATVRLAIEAQKNLAHVPYAAVMRIVQHAVSTLIDALRISNMVRVADLLIEVAEHINEWNSNHHNVWFTPTDEARWWQIETAWAILQNREPPPFPDLTA